MADLRDPGSHAAWQTQAEQDLNGELPRWVTPEGVEIPPLYTSRDLDALDYLETLPGFYPYVRGPYATMYAGRPWTIRQYAGFSTAEESNEFYKRCLAGGQKGLSVAFDLPTHRGFDSDHPQARGDVGKAGVAVDTVEDLKALFAGIDLGSVSVSMTMNGAVLPVLAGFLVAAEEQGVPLGNVRGTIQNDILKEFLVRNTFIYPPEPSMLIVADIIAYASANLPQFNSVSVSGYHMHEAGAPADLELAYTLADGLEYVRSAKRRGLVVDDFAPRLSFFFGIGMSFFMEIAKLRAARLLWATLMKHEFEPENPRSLLLRTHCQTSGVSLTAQDPLNNVVRTTVEALAAVLGGTQSLHTNAFDEALALPSDDAARVARNTQLVLQHETGVTHVADPLGGSYYVESLTHALAARAMAVIREVEALGGMTKAIGTGVPKQRIEAAAARRQARIDRGEDVIVGVNRYSVETPEPEVRRVDFESVLKTQCEKLRAVRAMRSDAAVQAALAALTERARSGSGLLEAAIEAMRARATVGEVSAALEKVWSRYQGSVPLAVGAYGGARVNDPQWQAVLERVKEFERAHGRRPRILVVKLGQDGHDRGARLIASAFVDLGFVVDVGPMFSRPSDAAQQAIDNDVHVVGVSSLAGGHDTLVVDLLQELRQRGAGHIAVVCGGVIPQGDRAALEAAGVRATFPSGTRVEVAANRVLDVIEATLDVDRV